MISFEDFKFIFKGIVDFVVLFIGYYFRSSTDFLSDTWCHQYRSQLGVLKRY